MLEQSLGLVCAYVMVQLCHYFRWYVMIAFLVHVDRFRLLSSIFFLFPGVVPPCGGNGKHCSIEQWLNYSIFINQS